MVTPGGALDRAVPPWLSLAWAAILITGTTLVVWGIMAARTRAESTGHMFHLVAFGLLAAVNVAVLDGGDVVALLVLAAVSLLRMRGLARSRAAQREAGRVLRGERS